MSELNDTLNDILQDKNTNLKPENLKQGITCLGINGIYEGPIKLFTSINEMQDDTNSMDGDIAVVYGPGYENFKADSNAKSLCFDEIIILHEACTFDKQIRLMGHSDDAWLDGNAYITPTSFSFYAKANSTGGSVSYASADGITYTRTNITGTTEEHPDRIDFTVPVQFMGDIEPYDPIFGEFMKIPIMDFEGIFHCLTNTSGILEWVFAPNQFSATEEYVYKKNFFGPNGTGTGNMFENVSTDLRDTNALACNDMIAIYSKMEPIIVTDDDISNSKYRWISSIPIRYDGTPVLDTSQLTTMYNFLNQNRGIKYIPKFDTSNVVNMSDAFSINPELLYVADGMDMISCTNLSYVLHSCVQLKKAPSFLNTNNVTNFGGAFEWCDGLVYVPVYDMSSCTSASNFVGDCPKLSDDSLNNIMQSCISAAKMQTKTLKHLGLTSEQAVKCTTLSNYQAFLDTGWTTGY